MRSAFCRIVLLLFIVSILVPRPLRAGDPSPAGMLLWLKGDSLSLPDGAAVSQWNDESGGGFHARAVAGNAPTFHANGLNQHATVQFHDAGNASNAGQFLDTTLNYDANGRSFTVFAVFRSNPTQDGINWRDTVLQQLDDPTLSTNALGRTILFAEMNERRDLRVFSFASANYTQSRKPMDVNRWTIETLVQTATPNGAGVVPVVGTNITMKLFRNGAVDGVHAAQTNAIASAGIWRIGDNKPRAGGLNGEIAEILVYNRPLDRIERADVERYLADKYALPLTGVTLSVNSAAVDDTAGGGLTLTEAIKFVNHSAVREPSADEQSQIEGDLNTDLRKEIHFQIPTNIPESIFDPLQANKTSEESVLGDNANFFLLDAYSGVPAGGFPPITANDVLIDGYTAFRSKVNTVPATGTNNNARLRMSFDLRNQAAVPYAFLIQGSNVCLRGLSFMDSTEIQRTAVIYDSGAAGGQVSGCRFGMFLTAQEVYSGYRAVLIRNTAGGQVVGTDGDGRDDIAEENIFVGHTEAVTVENSPGVRISGNWFGFFPGGSIAVQADTNYFSTVRSGILTTNADSLIVGTDANGISDAFEANVFGNLNGAVFVSGPSSDPSENMVFAGNKCGYAPLGSPATNHQFYIDGSVSNLVIGSDLGASGNNPGGNIIANNEGPVFTFNSPGNIAIRGNRLSGNVNTLFANLENTRQFAILGNTSLAPELLPESQTCKLVGSVPISAGTGEVALVAIDLYVADPDTASIQPQGAFYIGTFIEGSRLDLDPRPGYFAFGIPAEMQSAIGSAIGDAGVANLLITANYRFKESIGFETSPFSNLVPIPFSPCDPPPPPPVDFRILRISREAEGFRITWEAEPQATYVVEAAESLGSGFSPIATGIAGPDYLDVTPLPRRFYRIRSGP